MIPEGHWPKFPASPLRKSIPDWSSSSTLSFFFFFLLVGRDYLIVIANRQLVLYIFFLLSLVRGGRGEKSFWLFILGKIFIFILLWRWLNGNYSRRSCAYCIRKAGVRVPVAPLHMETRSFGVSLALFMVKFAKSI